MLNKPALSASANKNKNWWKKNSFTFKAAVSASGVKIFEVDRDQGRVVINNTITRYTADNMSFRAGDVVSIEFPVAPPTGFIKIVSDFWDNIPPHDYFEEIYTPLPRIDGLGVWREEPWFIGCRHLREIPVDLFANNPRIPKFSSTFSGCTSLTSVPEGLFANNTVVTSFDRVFEGCTSLTTIPERLFANNTAVTSFRKLCIEAN